MSRTFTSTCDWCALFMDRHTCAPTAPHISDYLMAVCERRWNESGQSGWGGGWGQGSRSMTEEEALETWEWETRLLPALAELKHREKWLKKCGRWFKCRPRHGERGRKSGKVVENSLKLKRVRADTLLWYSEEWPVQGFAIFPTSISRPAFRC